MKRFPLMTWAAALLSAAAVVSGQTLVRQGNVLDANPRVNSGGLNAASRTYPGSNANRIVSGNVAGGLGFRGYSPIHDPSSLFIRNYNAPITSTSGVSSSLGLSGLVNTRAGLPSDVLTSFSRDSVSVASARRGFGVSNRLPYYSPSSTVANVGAIAAGLNRPGSSQLVSPYTPARPDQIISPPDPLAGAGTGRGSLLSVLPRLVRIDSGQTLTGPINERLLGSPLFGAVREVPVDVLAAQTQRNTGGALSPIDRRLESTPPRPIPKAVGGVHALPPDAQPRDALPGDMATPQAAALRRPAGAASLSGPGGLRQPLDGTRSSPPADEATRMAARPALDELDLSRPLRSLVGTQASVLNQRLAEADDLLKRGQYYRAADTYEMARIMDPMHPFPLLGKAMALLAAGDYMSSANYLFTGTQLYDVMPRLHLDLQALIPDTRMLESRRAELERRVQLIDDFRLRFLLGYVEYSMGRRDEGLANMSQAADRLPPDLGRVREFVNALRDQPAATAPAATPATQPSAGR